jgi:trans-aconitate methyltransferase
MIDPLPFEPHRFRTAAEHYLAGRPPYSARLIARVAQLCGVGAADRVLDLGCGPGQLGRAFAPGVAEVVGIDPEPEMLRIARGMSAGLTNVEWREGSSYDLSPALGPFRLVCIGRAFHWMDRHDTLRRLDSLIVPGGAVALFSDSQPKVPDNAWRAAYREVLDRYAEGEPGRAHWRSPDWVRHEAILLDSPFCRLEHIEIIERHEVTADTLVARALSMSSTSPSRLGERTGQMVAELRAALPAGVAEGGTLREVVATGALLAWRAEGAGAAAS